MRLLRTTCLLCLMLLFTGCGGCGPGEKDKNKFKDMPKPAAVTE